MPIDIKGAYNQRPSQQAAPPRLELPPDVYQGLFIGVGEPYMGFDNFNGCPSCGVIDPENPRGPRKKGPGQIVEGLAPGGSFACVACEGTGMRKAKYCTLRYVLDTEELVQEVVTYKLSAPFKMKNGKTSKPSTMYKRFQTLSGLSDPEEIIAWGEALPEKVEIPVQIVIEGTTYPKVANVLKRFEPQNGKKPPPKLIPEDEAPF